MPTLRPRVSAPPAVAPSKRPLEVAAAAAEWIDTESSDGSDEANVEPEDDTGYEQDAEKAARCILRYIAEDLFPSVEEVKRAAEEGVKQFREVYGKEPCDGEAPNFVTCACCARMTSKFEQSIAPWRKGMVFGSKRKLPPLPPERS